MELTSILSLLEQGKVLVLPTDTLHALSCDATNDTAVKSLMATKGRKENHPLPILVKDLAQAKTIGVFNDLAIELAKKYWPGALTIVVPIKSHSILSKNINGSFDSIALRVPNGKIINEILKEFNRPIVGTSANISGQPNLLTEEEIKNNFEGKVAKIVFEGNLLAVPSTIVDCTQDLPRIIRQGAVQI